MQLGAVARFWARWQPDGAAIRFEGRDLTWAELDRRTDTLAGGLGKLGLGPGDRLGILGQNSPRWCELVIAAFKAGAVAVPVNPRMAPTEVTEIVAHAGCRVLAADGGFASCLDAVAGRLPDVAFVAIDGDTGRGTPIDEVAAGPPLAWEPSAAEDSEPALIAYTSGTTGAPKGVVLTHTNLWAHVVLRAFSDRWTSSVRTLLAVPLAFTGGIVNNFVATYGVGGTLVLERAFEPARALQLLVDERITNLIGVPVMWQGIAAAPGFADADLSALSTAITGGAPVPETLLRTFHAKGVLIRQAYALTEAGALACQTPEHLALDRPESAGLPNLGTEIRIAGDDDRPLPAGEVGEIQLRGPQVTTGYWNDPAATAEGLAGGWLHTGDLGRLDQDGLLEVVDRKKDMLISGGLNVYPAEVERVLAGYPGMVEAAVVGVADARWGETVAAIVRGPGPGDGPAVASFCRQRIADYKAPRYVVVRDEPLPRSMSGKVLRRQLRQEYRNLPETTDPVR